MSTEPRDLPSPADGAPVSLPAGATDLAAGATDRGARGPDATGQAAPDAADPAASATATAEARRRRGRQTTLDMVRSMVVILAFVGVVLLLAPQPDAVEQPELSTAEALVAQEQAAGTLGAEPVLLVPEPADAPSVDADQAAPVVVLGDGWRLDYARTEQTDEVPTWRVGVLSPDERRVDLEQAVDPTEEWLTRADGGRPGLPEPVELGGLTWTVQQRGDERTSYTYVDDAGGLTTAVTASSDSDDLREIVERVAAALQG